jgi:hypothetical protein
MIVRRPFLHVSLLTGSLLLGGLIALPFGALAHDTATPYQAIDRHALSAPASAERSLASLAAYLTAPAENDREKARSLYRWITANIIYDTRGFFSGQVGEPSPEVVLRHRSAVCEGFANLFQALGQNAGLDVVTIKGYAKGYGYLPGTGFREPPNHTWNAVKLDGKWELLDTTMGSGYLDPQGHLVRQFRSYYFMTPPDAFIYDHFPLDGRWQLLEDPLSRHDFESLVCLKQHFFNHDLRLLSHSQATIQTDNQVVVTLQAPQTALLLARLERGSQRLDERYTFVQKFGDKTTVHVKLPQPGQYRLRLYVKGKGDPGTYKAALDYLIQATAAASSLAGFPKVFGPFNEHAVRLHRPLDGYLKAGNSQDFELEAPDAEKVAVIIGKTWYYLLRSGNVFQGAVPIPKGALTVFAKFPDQEHFQGLLEFTGL